MTTKERLVRAIEELPDDATIEDAMERLLFLAKVERGIQQADVGETIPHEQVKERMAKFFDCAANTLTVWFNDPQEEHVCEETGDEIILMKDKSGQVIGFEKIKFSVLESEHWKVAFETIPV